MDWIPERVGGAELALVACVALLLYAREIEAFVLEGVRRGGPK